MSHSHLGESEGSAATGTVIFWKWTQIHNSDKVRSKRAIMALNDLEFAYAPLRDQVRDLREYL